MDHSLPEFKALLPEVYASMHLTKGYYYAIYRLPASFETIGNLGEGR
jgi:hypothetical protein